MSQPAPTVRSSLEDVWYLKGIRFGGRDLRIITQNFNGPCSFIAICNILILRGNIEVLPTTRRTVSYELLSQLVAEYLLTTSPDVDVSAALSVMPLTQKGMDLNPVFTSSNTFRPSGSVGAGGELKLFEQVGIPLLHGWLVDPDTREAEVLARVGDYDKAVELIAEVDHLTNGQFVVPDEMAVWHGVGASSSSGVGPSKSTGRNWTAEESKKLEDAIVVRRFLDSTQSQLTYHGLFHLATTLPPNTLCALFRNSHLSVLYKHAPPSSPASPVPDLSSLTLNTQSTADVHSTSSIPQNSDLPATKTDTMASSSAQTFIPAAAGASPDARTHEGSALFTLVSDQVFLNEPSVIWERFEDIDGGWSTFVDSDFVRSSPAGGDFAGQTAEEALRAMEAQERFAENLLGVVDPQDHALALQIQAEEENIARRDHEEYIKEEEAKRRAAVEQQGTKPMKVKKEKKKGDCIIM